MAVVLSQVLPMLEPASVEAAVVTVLPAVSDKISYFSDISLEGDFLALGCYFPTVSHEFVSDIWSKVILDLKRTTAELAKVPQDEREEHMLAMHRKDKVAAINFFAKTLTSLLNPAREFIVIGVPSSDKTNYEHGVRMVATIMARLNSTTRNKNIKCGNHHLIRTVTQQPAHIGGSKSLEQQLETLGVMNPDSLRGKTVVLIDDVTTTGNAMEAARQKLLSVGVAKVICIALGKTVRHLADITDAAYKNVLQVNEVVKRKAIAFIDKYDSAQKKQIRFSIQDLLAINLQLFSASYLEAQRKKALAAAQLQRELELQRQRELAKLLVLVAEPKRSAKKRKPLEEIANNQPTLFACFKAQEDGRQLADLVAEAKENLMALKREESAPKKAKFAVVRKH